MNILVSACLLGFNVKYDGSSNSHLIDSDKLERLKKMANLIPFCPEIYGGLESPRKPCEIKKGKVKTRAGGNRTEQYKKGAQEALKAAHMFNCRYALLKENSPSCGYGTIYDGTFSHTKIQGNGITAQLLSDSNIKIFGESKMDELLEAVRLAKAPQQLSFEF